jgi:cytochrome c oxidase subunit 2
MIHFVIVGILVVVSTYLVFLGLTSADLLPFQASEQAVIIDGLFDIHWFLISFFFSLIVVFMLYSFIVFRRKPGEKGDGDHFEGNARLEVAWTIIPLIIVIGLAIIGAQALGDVEARDPGAMVVNVVGKQWGWSFEYPEFEVSTTELVLPVDRQVLLRLQSLDVIHSFWVPEFRVKQDALPGGEAFIRELRITPNEIGEYQVRCAEMCGLDHANMKSPVIVMKQQDFQTWMASQSCQDSEEVCNGRDLATTYCTACHYLDGNTLIAPSWIGLFGSTVPLNDGTTIVADEAYILKSILDPALQVHDGYNPVMPPNFADTLTEQQIEELIAFIKSLAE